MDFCYLRCNNVAKSQVCGLFPLISFFHQHNLVLVTRFSVVYNSYRLNQWYSILKPFIPLQHFLQVYEHITFDNNKHISLASLPGMQERTIITSSLSKSFSVTGSSLNPLYTWTLQNLMAFYF